MRTMICKQLRREEDEIEGGERSYPYIQRISFFISVKMEELQELLRRGSQETETERVRDLVRRQRWPKVCSSSERAELSISPPRLMLREGESRERN